MKNGNSKSHTTRHNGNQERDSRGRFESDDYQNNRSRGNYGNRNDSDSDLMDWDQRDRRDEDSRSSNSDYSNSGYANRNRNNSNDQYLSNRDRNSDFQHRDDDDRNSDGGSYGQYGSGTLSNNNFGGGYSTRRSSDLLNRENDDYRGTSQTKRWSDGSWNENESDQATSHRGKGPKGYKRSDERIQEDINDRLSDDHQLDASNIEVKVEGGEVTLSGTVMDRNAKRRAEDIVESISGVSNVQNSIRVSKDNTSTAAEGKSKANAKHS